MVKIYLHVAGNTLGCHKSFLKKLSKRRLKEVSSLEKCDYIIVFCPIVSRFETDVNSALSEISGEQKKKMIVVAMHHTFDPNYTLPNMRQMNNRAVDLMVDCLYHETKGLLKCACNKKARKLVKKELGLSSGFCHN